MSDYLLLRSTQDVIFRFISFSFIYIHHTSLPGHLCSIILFCITFASCEEECLSKFYSRSCFGQPVTSVKQNRISSLLTLNLLAEKKIWCYDCSTEKNPECGDPSNFSLTRTQQRNDFLTQCEGCCVKIIKKKGTRK